MLDQESYFALHKVAIHLDFMLAGGGIPVGSLLLIGRIYLKFTVATTSVQCFDMNVIMFNKILLSESFFIAR